MKTFLFILIFLVTNYSFSQLSYTFCFDSLALCENENIDTLKPSLIMDTNATLNNVWQIGTPQKSVLSSAYSQPRVIITDTINSYPPSDTSFFIIEHPPILLASSSVHWSNFVLSFRYFVDSDPITDFGRIEISPDNGATWIDLINDPTYAQFIEWHKGDTVDILPILSGSSGGWKKASAHLHQLAVVLDMQPGTIFLWRFSFISDGNQTNKDGLMYDDISMFRSPPIGLEEQTMNLERKLMKVVDLFGRESEDKPNTTLIYVYSDGSTEKIFRLE